eukprot:scaffold179878_cov29-Prasinocladus_malaysianus.AAC.2
MDLGGVTSEEDIPSGAICAVKIGKHTTTDISEIWLDCAAVYKSCEFHYISGMKCPLACKARQVGKQ